MSTEDFLFPMFEYHLDESDPDIVVLRRQDDSFVAAFSARGVKREGIIEAAREDYRKLVQVHMAQHAQNGEDIAALDLEPARLRTAVGVTSPRESPTLTQRKEWGMTS